ncbi:hypothetical protein SERLA73DRAFT_79779 [Serpula lacrymans var. lacrymans S7.3]|uniref:Uncharacterized protein n=1 Tax=Serpula lacrymans var. lacrymans (strain S7.3) TaxID=936435 RepID=F8QHJ2_SERL3|nr:hypothetical protein SERLA73DRAFT_79779 [Serpula lacrymans var. lacrymans S7.3]
MAEDDAYGFVNPADVLQSCHLAPAFYERKLHPNGIGMSNFAQDAQDWKNHYVNWLAPATFNAKETYQYFSYRLGVFVTNDFMEYLPSSNAAQTSETVNYQSGQLDKDNGEDSDVSIEEDVNSQLTFQNSEGKGFSYNQDSDEDSDTDKLSPIS